MEKPTHWLSLWRDVIEAHENGRLAPDDLEQSPDRWKERARDFAERARQRWSRPDTSRDFICAQLDPHATVLDIGAGTGVWTMMLAPQVAHVTAIDPSPSMLAILHEEVSQANLANVRVVDGAWPDVAVEPHDYALCSHAMYGAADFAGFIRQMVASTRKMCFLIMRVPNLDGPMAEAARTIWGQPFDRPNAMIAYNILLEMGIYPNVLMEIERPWTPRATPDLEFVLREVKRRFGLSASSAHDDYLRDLLRRRLQSQDGQYLWPEETRSALISWRVDGHD
ncbi:MAG: methyltransferase domain-containing protein [Chloroflexi bacterium]|nr:methyltransferase domain-containing protein [Chloroflexota bacterium]